MAKLTNNQMRYATREITSVLEENLTATEREALLDQVEHLMVNVGLTRTKIAQGEIEPAARYHDAARRAIDGFSWTLVRLDWANGTRFLATLVRGERALIASGMFVAIDE